MLISQINIGAGAEEPLKWAEAGARHKKKPGSAPHSRCPAIGYGGLANVAALREIFVELGDGADAVEELFQREVLVGGVDGIAAQTEAHEDGFHAQYFFEGGNDGNAPA